LGGTPSNHPAINETIKKAMNEFIFPHVMSSTKSTMQNKTIRIVIGEQ